MRPQRFRFRHTGGQWIYGACHFRGFPGSMWKVILSGCSSNEDFGFDYFDDSPWEVMGSLVGDCETFQWIDNDRGWPGDMENPPEPEPEPVTYNVVRLQEMTQIEVYVCQVEATSYIEAVAAAHGDDVKWEQREDRHEEPEAMADSYAADVVGTKTIEELIEIANDNLGDEDWD